MHTASHQQVIFMIAAVSKGFLLESPLFTMRMSRPDTIWPWPNAFLPWIMVNLTELIIPNNEIDNHSMHEMLILS